MRGVTIVSAVAFLALTISVTALVYQMGMPLIEKMQQSAALSRMRSAMANVGEKIEEVASEGRGSRRVVDLDFSLGRLGLDAARNMLFWEMNSKHMLMLPRTAEYFGSMVVGSNLNASVYEAGYGGSAAYVLENSHVRAYIRKIGSPGGFESYNISDVLLALYQKDSGKWIPLESLNITIDGNPDSGRGIGYTYAERTGDLLPYGRVEAYMESGYINYTVAFTLESGTDFLKVEVVV